MSMMKKKEFTNKWISQRLGALPSKVDIRSFKYMKLPDIGALAATPAEYYKLVEFAPDNFKRDQGNVGTCVGWDWGYVFETQLTLLLKHLKATGVFGIAASNQYLPEADKTKEYLRLVLQDMSSGWAYQLSRKNSIPPVPPGVEGSTNLGAVRAAAKVGICPESLCPTDTVAPFDIIQQTLERMQAAGQYKIASYHNIPDHNETLKATMCGVVHELPYKMPDGSPGASPLMAAFPIHSNYKESYDDGIVPMPSGKLLGGHSSPLYAYRVIDGEEYWGNFGSWGPDIGDNGWFWIPFEYPFYPNDFWLMKILPSPEPPTPTCVWEFPNWITRILNWMDSSGNEYYYGVPVGGDD